MMDLSISFEPLLPWPVVAVLAALAGMLVLYGVARSVRGSWLRACAWLALALALMNPAISRENREALKTVVAVVTDETESARLDERGPQGEAARAALSSLIEAFPNFELRQITARNGGAETGDASTALFSALREGVQDVPPDQLGGAIFITDGQVHDAPETIEELGFDAPVHTLLTGSESDADRLLEILRAPRFGIVGETQEVAFRVLETNIGTDGLIEVRAYIDGELTSIEQVLPGEEASFYFDVPHGGKNVIELRADVVNGEITPVNNQAFTILDGIRENLRVLLVSGEPHAGERTWRNLLKSDASVDLVHFTILRPPEKQDGTPINQLSLIAFPTRELFIEKIDEFDLIIFDRYQRRGVLPLLYFDNIARYLTDGGAILIAAGPEHADQSSIHQTPLASVLPFEPSGEISEEPFKPQVTADGRRHPVTRDLPGLPALDSGVEPDWSRWFRLIDGVAERGDVVMDAGGDRPLLVLDRPGEGRIAMLLSDHVWLWARGFEGGGPHTQLLRRLGHWLMKEPELDEEALRAEADNNRLTIERQTMGDTAGPLDIVGPDGKAVRLEFEPRGDGRFVAEYETDQLGLYRFANGDLTALASVGPSNPREYRDVVSTGAVLQDIVSQTDGTISRLARTDVAATLPRVVPVRANGAASGNGWIGLRTTDATVLRGIDRLPLFAGFLGLGILLMLLAGTWAREGR